MQVVDIAVNLSANIDDYVNDMITQYRSMSREELIEHVASMNRYLNRFFEIQQIILDRVFEVRPDLQDDYAQFEQAHQDMKDIYHQMIMTHVDEPDFLDLLNRFEARWHCFNTPDYQDFVEKVQNHLASTDEGAIMAEIEALTMQLHH